MMSISMIGLALIKRSEGLRLEVYNDVKGIPTIGYGHRVKPGETFPSPFTESDAENLLDKDVQAAELAVTSLVKVALTQGQIDALVDFVFNLGAGQLERSTLLRDLNANLYEQAGRQLLLWDHAGEREVAALEKRRQAEYKLFNSTAFPYVKPQK